MIFDVETLYAFFVRGSARHWAVTGDVELLERSEELVVSPFVIAPADLDELRLVD